MLKSIAPFVEFAINQDYIAEFLCINKEKPEMQCNGKCHLFKEVEKQQEELPDVLQISMEEYPIGFVEFLSLNKNKQLEPTSIRVFAYNSNYRYLHSYLIFHPPIFRV